MIHQVRRFPALTGQGDRSHVHEEKKASHLRADREEASGRGRDAERRQGSGVSAASVGSKRGDLLTLTQSVWWHEGRGG